MSPKAIAAREANAERQRLWLMQRMGLPDDPATPVKFSSIIPDLTFDHAVGILRLSDDVEALKFIRHLDDKLEGKLKQEGALHQRLQRLENGFDIAVAHSGVDPYRILGLLTEHVARETATKASLFISQHTQQVLQNTLAMTELPANHADRKMWLQTAGIAPVPKSQTTITNIRDQRVLQQTQVNLGGAGIPRLEDVTRQVEEALQKVPVTVKAAEGDVPR